MTILILKALKKNLIAVITKAEEQKVTEVNLTVSELKLINFLL